MERLTGTLLAVTHTQRNADATVRLYSTTQTLIRVHVVLMSSPFPFSCCSSVPILSPPLSVSLTAFNLSSRSRLLPSASLLPSLRNHDSPFLSSLLAPIQNPSFSLLSSSSIFVLRSPFSYFNPVILSSVRCIVVPMCEMHFKNALCWTSLLISLPN